MVHDTTVSETINRIIYAFEKKEAVLGILLVGSYAYGNAKEDSDIDIRIIYGTSTVKRDKGLLNINGYMVSYLGNPIIETYQLFYDQLKMHSRFQARMIARGKILLDKTGEIAHLQREAQVYMERDFPLPSQSAMQMEVYDLWKYKEELLKEHPSGYPVMMYYHLFLQKAFNWYSKFLGTECVFQHTFFKLHTYLSDPGFREQFVIDEFPDTHFGDLFLEAMQSDEHTIKHFTESIWQRIDHCANVNFESLLIEG